MQKTHRPLIGDIVEELVEVEEGIKYMETTIHLNTTKKSAQNFVEKENDIEQDIEYHHNTKSESMCGGWNWS